MSKPIFDDPDSGLPMLHGSDDFAKFFDRGIDFPKLVADVRAFAKKFPDRVYDQAPNKGCAYNPDDVNPDGCIVGAGLREQGYRFVCHSTVNVVLADFPENEGEKLMLVWLRAVQGHQDSSIPWGKAVAFADDDCGKV